MPDRDPFADLPSLVGPDALTLVGGVVDAKRVDALVEWLRGMSAASWWSFREYTDRMRLTAGLAGPGDDLPRFVWGRWFGEPGDLEVRRHGARFRWRWVGEPSVQRPDTPIDFDFFAPGDGSTPQLRPRNGERALLWARNEARVATADDDTLGLLTDERFQLRYVTYDDHGVVAAVRYQRIEPAQETAATPASGGG